MRSTAEVLKTLTTMATAAAKIGRDAQRSESIEKLGEPEPAKPAVVPVPRSLPRVGKD